MSTSTTRTFPRISPMRIFSSLLQRVLRCGCGYGGGLLRAARFATTVLFTIVWRGNLSFQGHENRGSVHVAHILFGVLVEVAFSAGSAR